jgi:hypothetical protein
MVSIDNTPGFSGEKPDIEQPGVETFQRSFPQDPGKFCTPFNILGPHNRSRPSGKPALHAPCPAARRHAKILLCPWPPMPPERIPRRGWKTHESDISNLQRGHIIIVRLTCMSCQFRTTPGYVKFRRNCGQRRRSSTNTETLGFSATPMVDMVAAAIGRLPNTQSLLDRGLSVREIVPDQTPKPKPR